MHRPVHMPVHMPVMNIRVVRVLVRHGLVAVRVRVRLFTGPCPGVLMLMMRVVRVWVSVLKRLVRMLVLMPLAHMQPNAQRHERCG